MIRQKIGFIGCGNMGEAILAGLIKNRCVASSNIFVIDAFKSKEKQIQKKYKVKKVPSLCDLSQKVDVLILAIKPQQLQEVARELKQNLNAQHVVISILAGTTTKRLRQALGNRARFVRVMPNLGASLGAACTAIAQNSPCSKSDLKLAQTIFNACGTTIFLHENQMDLVTALSGSGPAYFFFLAELLIQEGKKRGLTHTQAHALVTQTAYAAGLMMKRVQEDPKILKERVTSKKGTTEAALKALEQKGWKKAVGQAIQKAVRRAAQLSKGK